MNPIFWIVLSLALGILLATTIILIIKSKSFQKNENTNNQRIEKARLEEQLLHEKKENQKKEEEIEKIKSKYDLLLHKVGQLENQNKTLTEQLTESKSKHKEIGEQLQLQFKSLAADLMNEKKKEMLELNQKNMDSILTPLKQRIEGFEKTVKDNYHHEFKERVSLREEVKKLHELNVKVSDEANQLAKALKGDQKIQGNWGEMILERVLERSGLIKGEEYDLQVSTNNEDEQRIQPDAIIYLPEQKHLVVDSKVSLLAYEKYVQSETEEERQQYLKDHLLSIKQHIKSLSQKKYQSSKDLDSPDFVLLFMPIEASFALSVQSSADIFNEAWDQKIVIVSPSTLLATLKTVASLWKQEKQSRNAFEIAKESGLLYNKFVGFVEDLEDVGVHINRSIQSHEKAFKKLQFGAGNLISKAEKIKKLGAKASKNLPDRLLKLERDEE